MTQDLAAGIAAVRARGGVPAVLVAGPVGDGPASLAEALARLSDVRAGLPVDVRLVVELTSGASAEVRQAVSSYVEAIVSPDPAPGPRGWRHLGSITVEQALQVTKSGGAEQWTVEVPGDVLAARQFMADLASAAAPPPDALVESVEVSGRPAWTADEIVARHQAAARRQAAAITTSISRGTLTLTFEAPGFPAPVTVSSETVVYQGGGKTELEQRRIRVNGIAFEGRGVPRLPIIEPERVAVPPLVIALGRKYRYQRHPDDTVGGIRCFVVAFEPAGAEPSFRGRAWISVEGFHLVRVAATQTMLRGAIVSSEQVDDFREIEAGRWMLVRSDVRQLYEGAAHRTPIHRVLAIDAVEVNPPDFTARLQAAYRSPSVMLRDTAEGYRYLRRQPASTGGDGVLRAAETVDRASRVRTLAAGVIVDPNISIPLPFAGLNYLDFDLFGTGTQLNVFAGGSFAQLAVSVPSVRGSRWQLGGRAFAIASSYNDRLFRGGREQFDENIRQRPASASAWLMRPLGTRLNVRVGYEIDYTAFARAPETKSAFRVPADQVAHGLRLAIDGQRDGWAATAWWNPVRRSGWRAWGEDGGDPDRHRTFQRLGASVSRTLPFTPQLVTRIEGTVMGGWDLDRFSRYTFGSFDNRLRGYPAALVRYDRGALVRFASAWSLSRFVRLDGFFDSALVRDPGYGSGYRSYTGTGAAVEAPLPFGILGSVEWGFGFRGVNTDGSLGTQVVRVSAFKVF